jgi:preprotein translocase subunit SecY
MATTATRSAGFADMWRIEELRKKILLTLGMMVVFRLGSHVLLPGIDPEAVAAWKLKGGGDNALFGLVSTLSAGAIGSCTIFSLGIMPYISASIIFSLLVKVLPDLEKIAKEGTQGQRKINQWTRLATVPICILQGIFLWRGTLAPGSEMLGGGAANFVPQDVWDSWWFGPSTLVGLTAGTIFLMWVGEQITERGVGNGISLLIMAGIVARIPDAFLEIGAAAAEPGRRAEIVKLFVLVGLFMVVTLGVVYLTKGQRRIPVQYAKLVRGRAVYGGQRHYLPLKVNAVSVMPVIFASTLIVVSRQLLHLAGITFLDSNFVYSVLLSAGILFFSFFWVGMMFNPKELSDQIKEHGAFIPGIRPGRKTQEFLDDAIQRITLAGGVALAIVALVPDVLIRGLGLPMIAESFLGGTSILIAVSVAMDLADKINSYMLMRNYDGFMGGGGVGGGGRTDGGGF